jgi:hypothetical protein
MDQKIKAIQALAEKSGLELCGYKEFVITEDEVKIKHFSIEFREASK